MYSGIEMSPKEVKHAITTIRKRARDSKRVCSYYKCDNTAIESHLLQKNGILSQIANKENQVIELSIDPYKPDAFVFRATNISSAFTFSGFCNTHDTEIFKEIEQKHIDYANNRTQLLFSYRAVINERIKKEININVYDIILNSFRLKLFLDNRYLNDLLASKEQESLAISDSKYYEMFILNNIRDPSLTDFYFLTFELPKMELCACGVFTYETTLEMDYLLKTKKHRMTDPFTQIYFNLLPINDRTIVIIGCLKKDNKKCWEYINDFHQKDSKKSFKKN